MYPSSIISEARVVELKHATKGRKRLSVDEKRTNKKTTNFNDSELAIVEELARKNELTVSDYIRQAAIGGDTNSIDKQANRMLIQALAETAKGLNKVIEKAHGRNGSIDSQEAAQVASIMLDVTDILSDIRANIK